MLRCIVTMSDTSDQVFRIVTEQYYNGAWRRIRNYPNVEADEIGDIVPADLRMIPQG